MNIDIINRYGVSQIAQDYQQILERFTHVSISSIYDCHIIELDKVIVYARMIDIDKPDSPDDIQAELPYHLFPENKKLEEGTIFYLFVGSEKQANGSEIDFIHIELNRQVWTQEMIEQVHKDAEKMFKLLKTTHLTDEE